MAHSHLKFSLARGHLKFSVAQGHFKLLVAHGHLQIPCGTRSFTNSLWHTVIYKFSDQTEIESFKGSCLRQKQWGNFSIAQLPLYPTIRAGCMIFVMMGQ